MKVGDLVFFKDTEGSLGLITKACHMDTPCTFYVEWYDERAREGGVDGWFREDTLGVVSESR